MKKRIGAVLMGVLLSTSLIGTNVFAAETEPPAESETVFEIVEGATGTYVKGSKKDHVIKVRISRTAEKIHKVTVDRDDNELDRDNWSAGDSEEVPPTTEVPSTTEPPTEVPGTTEPPTEVPGTTEPPTEVPGTTEPPTEVPGTTEPPTDGPGTTEPPTEVPATPGPPTEVPGTTEPPTEVPATPGPPTEVPGTTEPPTEVPATTGPTTDTPAPTTDAPAPTELIPPSADPSAAARKVKKSSVKSYNILTPINVQAAEIETKIVPVTIKGTYLETLSLGKHTVSAYILDAGVEKSVTATINVVAQETTSEAPATSEAPEATTEEDTEDVDDNDEEDTEDESSTTKKDNTTSTKKKTSKKSKSSKTGDNSQIMLYLAIALVSGCAIVYFARKKATK